MDFAFSKFRYDTLRKANFKGTEQSGRMHIGLRAFVVRNSRKEDFQQSGICDQQRLRPACAYVQSDQSLYSSLDYSMSVKLLNEHLLEVLSLRGGCTGSSESTPVKMQHCRKSRHGSNDTFISSDNVNMND